MKSGSHFERYISKFASATNKVCQINQTTEKGKDFIGIKPIESTGNSMQVNHPYYLTLQLTGRENIKEKYSTRLLIKSNLLKQGKYI